MAGLTGSAMSPAPEYGPRPVRFEYCVALKVIWDQNQ